MFVAIGYGDSRENFIAFDSSRKQLEALVASNRPQYLISDDSNTVQRVMDGIPFTIEHDTISFESYDNLPILNIVSDSRVLVNPLSEQQSYSVITCSLVDNNNTVVAFTGPLATKILKPSNKVMEVEADFVDGIAKIAFPPDEGGVWEIPLKGVYSFYKVVESMKINVVYKLPSVV
jgi:hypothetical protein